MAKEERDASAGWEREYEYLGVSPNYSGKKRPPMPKDYQYERRTPIPDKSYNLQVLYNACLNVYLSNDESVVNAKNAFFEERKEQLTDILDHIEIKDGIVDSLLGVFVNTYNIFNQPIEGVNERVDQLEATVESLKTTSGQVFIADSYIYKYVDKVVEYFCRKASYSTLVEMRNNIEQGMRNTARALLKSNIWDILDKYDDRSEKDALWGG